MNKFKPSIFTVAFALIVTAITMKYMTLGGDGFYTCGLPFQYIKQIPIEGENLRMGFSINYFLLIVDLIIWYLIGVGIENGIRVLSKKKAKSGK